MLVQQYVLPNPSLFVSLFPLKYYAAADDFFPHTAAGGKSVLELGNSDTELGKSALNGGNSISKLGNFASNGGNSAPHKNKEKP